MDSIPAFGVIDQTEVFTGFLDGDDVHVSSWVFGVGPDFAVDFDHPSHEDSLAFLTSQSVVKTVSNEDGQWQAFPQFVRTSVGPERVNAPSFGKHPVVRSIKGFEMFLRSATSHGFRFLVSDFL